MRRIFRQCFQIVKFSFRLTFRLLIFVVPLFIHQFSPSMPIQSYSLTTHRFARSNERLLAALGGGFERFVGCVRLVRFKLLHENNIAHHAGIGFARVHYMRCVNGRLNQDRDDFIDESRKLLLESFYSVSSPAPDCRASKL
jgi:hypothetical protein